MEWSEVRQAREGTKVRASFEGEVKDSAFMVHENSTTAVQDKNGFMHYIFLGSGDVELVSHPEPEYEVGKFYRSDLGSIYEYLGGEGMSAWQRVKHYRYGFDPGFTGKKCGFSLPARPMTEVDKPEQPEPHYTPGIYRDAKDHIYRRTRVSGKDGENAWYRMATSPLGEGTGYVAHDVPSRPLVKLTPESK